MFSTHSGQPIAIVNKGLSDDEIIFIKKDTDEKSVLKAKPIRNIEVHDGKFQHLPSEEIRVSYIAGPSGSGKSTYAADYIHKYRLLHPKSKFFLFSKVKKDDVLDKLKPHRITISEDLIEDPIELDDITPNSIILFDDIDTISNKKIQTSINNIKEQILEMGRHLNIQCITTSHLINGNDRKASRTILNELQSLTFFPQSGSSYQIKYILKQYFGFSNVQINKILSLESRWVTIIKSYPQVILSEHNLIFATALGEKK